MTDIDQLLQENSGIFLDIGCGEYKHPYFIGMDIRPLPGVDIVHDFEVFPWPLPDGSVKAARAIHVVEHINPHKFGFINFMNEVWRILQPGGEFAIATPHGSSQGYIQDPTHCNPCNEATWDYFVPDRASNLWYIYKPKPWYLKALIASKDEHKISSHPAGNMEVILVKLDIDRGE